MRLPGFIGPSYVNRSVNVDAERLVNLYPEVIDGGGTGVNRALLHGTPGLRTFADTGAGPVRAIWAADNRCFAVSGGAFVELLPNGSVVSRGTVAAGTDSATISSNGTGGHQLLITASECAYVYDWSTTTFTALTGGDLDTPTYPVAMGAFLDGYFLVLKAKSNEFRISGLEDGLTWDPLDVAQRSQSTDELQSMVVSHRELWLLGGRSTEVWYNTSDADFPFAPIAGATMDIGAASPFSALILDNALFWLGADQRGQGIVYRSQGYSPQRISTHALETALTRAGSLRDAVAWSYQEDGHAYYCLSARALETTWVYDCATQLWHERGHWDEVRQRYVRHVGRCHAWVWNRHLVGDRTSGLVYDQSLAYYDDELAETAIGVTPSEPDIPSTPYPAPTGGLSTLIDTTTGSSREGLAAQTVYYKVVALFGTVESAPLVIGPVVTTESQKRIGIKWDGYSTDPVGGVSPTGLRVYRSGTADFSGAVEQLTMTLYPAPEPPGNLNAWVEGTPGSETYSYWMRAWNPLVGYSALTSQYDVTDGPTTLDSTNYVALDCWEDAAIDTGFFDVPGSENKLWVISYGRASSATWMAYSPSGHHDTGGATYVGYPFTAPTVTADLPITARWLLDDWPGLADSASIPWVTL